MNKPALSSRHKGIVFLGLAFHFPMPHTVGPISNVGITRWLTVFQVEVATLLDTTAGGWVLMVRQSEIVRV